jgi:hypothetical protein
MKYIKLIVQNRVIPMKKPINKENYDLLFLFAVIVMKQLTNEVNFSVHSAPSC